MDHLRSPVLEDIAGYLMKQIDNECMGDEDHTFLILKVFFHILHYIHHFKNVHPEKPLFLYRDELLFYFFNEGHW